VWSMRLRLLRFLFSGATTGYAWVPHLTGLPKVNTRHSCRTAVAWVPTRIEVVLRGSYCRAKSAPLIDAKSCAKTRDLNISAASAATLNDAALITDPRSLIQSATQRRSATAGQLQADDGLLTRRPGPVGADRVSTLATSNVAVPTLPDCRRRSHLHMGMMQGREGIPSSICK